MRAPDGAGRFDIAQHLRRVDSPLSERRPGVGWIRKTLPRQLIGRGSRDERLRLLRTGHRFGPRLRGRFAAMIAIIGPAVCGLLAQSTT